LIAVQSSPIVSVESLKIMPEEEETSKASVFLASLSLVEAVLRVILVRTRSFELVTPRWALGELMIVK
jgi:hypothetical protein